MTEEINKYHTSKIYKITSPQCDKFYIGSTTATLNRRLSIHKSDYKRYIEKNTGSCITSFEVVKFDDCIIELIKEVNCQNRKELAKIEGECILEYHDRILNKNVAGRTQKEWTEKNKDIIKEQRKEWTEANNEKIKEQMKKYKEANKEKIREKLREKINCICGDEFTKCNIRRHEKSKKHQLFISTN
jgi:hypothetical protein